MNSDSFHQERVSSREHLAVTRSCCLYSRHAAGTQGEGGGHTGWGRERGQRPQRTVVSRGAGGRQPSHGWVSLWSTFSGKRHLQEAGTGSVGVALDPSTQPWSNADMPCCNAQGTPHLCSTGDSSGFLKQRGLMF